MLTVGGGGSTTLFGNRFWQRLCVKQVTCSGVPLITDTVGTTTACLEYGGGCISKFLVGMAMYTHPVEHYRQS